LSNKIKRQPRSFSIHIDPQNLREFDGVAFDFKEQKIWGNKNGDLYPLLGKTRLVYKRKRQNKQPKILHESISPTCDAWFSANHQLLSYDHLIAIDTNTYQLGGSTVSVTAAFHLIPTNIEPNFVSACTRVLALVEFWNVVNKPENLGWWQILEAISVYPNNFAGKIGLVVDSDLGNHQAFNNREMPIFGDYYLPENVSILYGSDKGGPEHLSTKMIKYCHNLALDLYKTKNMLLTTKNIVPGVKGVFSHIRQWDVDDCGIRPFYDSVISDSNFIKEGV
jgi:hypothetical protein